MYRQNEFDMPQEDSDPDKKLFSVEQRRAQFEKKVFWIVLLAFVFLWTFLIQDMLIEYGHKNLDFGWYYGPPKTE